MSAASRSYALAEGEPVVEGIRRIAAGRADFALEQLRQARGEQLAGSVHEARKSLKKLRSLLRLVRGSVGEGTYKLENGRFGDAGRLLSPQRDADALGETIDALAARYAGELDPASLEPLARALSGTRAAPEADRPPEIARAISLIEAGRDGIAAWTLEREDFKLVRDGLRRAYEGGRVAMAFVAREPDPEAVHGWRKRVKDLWYMSAVVERSWPTVVGSIADQAHELSSLLGDHHDLAVLADRLRADPGLPGDGVPQPTLLDLIERRQDELIGRALPLGRRLFTEKPKRFVARIGAYWDAGPAGG